MWRSVGVGGRRIRRIVRGLGVDRQTDWPRREAVNEALSSFSSSSSSARLGSAPLPQLLSLSVARRHSTRLSSEARHTNRGAARDATRCARINEPLSKTRVRPRAWRERGKKKTVQIRSKVEKVGLHTTVLFYPVRWWVSRVRRIVKHEPDCGAARRIMALFTLSAAAPFPLLLMPTSSSPPCTHFCALIWSPLVDESPPPGWNSYH